MATHKPVRRTYAYSDRGFTLVEALVVIGILSILAAVIMSAIVSSREKARQATCMSNLRQIGLALAMYDQDSVGVPPRMQTLWNSGYIHDSRVLVCPDDWTKNWGGLVYETVRKQLYPTLPPETIHYSYVYAVPELQAYSWRTLLSVDGPEAGILACQTHGGLTFDNLSNPYAHNSAVPPCGPGAPAGAPCTSAPTVLDIQGPILRLRLDGSVVFRNVKWTQIQNGITANPWLLYSDNKQPPPGK